MPGPDVNPAVADAISCCRRELGDQAAFEVVAAAAVEATEYAVEDPPVRGDQAADEAAWRVWWATWQALAAAAPESFAVDPSHLRSRGSEFLAYLHARRRDAKHLPALTLTGAEQRDLTSLRALVRRWTGLGTLTANDTRVIEDACVPLRHIDSLARHDGVMGWALGSEPACRQQAVFFAWAVDELRDGRHGICLTSAVLHEELHNALNLAAGPPTDGRLGVLADEVGVLVCQLAVDCARTGTVSWDRVARAAGARDDAGPLLRVLDLLPADGGPRELVVPLIGARLHTRHHGGDHAVAAALNAALGCERSPQRWRLTLSDMG